ncbi:hypothetical protein [Dendronalium phyllosphericum]|nr:hypothetical protein [Dendronalium phyllosphericum]
MSQRIAVRGSQSWRFASIALATLGASLPNPKGVSPVVATDIASLLTQQRHLLHLGRPQDRSGSSALSTQHSALSTILALALD